MLSTFMATVRRLPAKICIFLIKGYRYFISPWLGPRCRFYPSCSSYALEALQAHPFFFALWIISKRLLKCHPWHAGGDDPVPQYRKLK